MGKMKCASDRLRFAGRGASARDTVLPQGLREKQDSTTDGPSPEVAFIAEAQEGDGAFRGAIVDRLRMAMGEANRVKSIVMLAEVLEDLDPTNVGDVVAMIEGQSSGCRRTTDLAVPELLNFCCM